MMNAHRISSYWLSMMHKSLNREPIREFPPTAIDRTCYTRHKLLNADTNDFLRWQLNGASLNHEFDVNLDRFWPETLTDSSIGGWAEKLLLAREHKLAIAFSGGLDSAVAALYARHQLGYLPSDVALVHVRYGAPYSSKELGRAKELYAGHLSFSVSGLYEVTLTREPINVEQMGKGYIIPLRNTVIASVAAAFAPTVWVVGNYRPDDAAPGAAIDKGRRFYGEVSSILSRQYARPISVVSPFLHWTKADSVKWYERTADRDSLIALISDTTSCYHPTKVRCGECFSCAKLAMMLVELDIPLSGFGLDSIAQRPEFGEYLKREAAKGRSIPDRWAAILAT